MPELEPILSIKNLAVEFVTADLFRRIRATQLSFLQNMLGQGLLGSTDGSLPFSVICDTSNNPFSRTNLGYVQSDAQVQYQAIGVVCVAQRVVDELLRVGRVEFAVCGDYRHRWLQPPGGEVRGVAVGGFDEGLHVGGADQSCRRSRTSK